MVATDTIPAPIDEHLVEDGASKVETVVEDECDLPVQEEESRNPSAATAQETDGLPSSVSTPGVDTSDESSTPTNDRGSSWLRRDGAETAKPSSGNFWFRKQTQSEQDSVNLAALRDLDETAKKNAGSSPQGGVQNGTAIVVRSEPVNVLWNVISEAVRRSALWRAATRVQESSRAAAEQRAKRGAAMRHGIRKFFRRRNADGQATAESETERQSSRQPWWRRFRRNRSQVDQSSRSGEMSTAIVPYNGGPSPVATVMKKAAAGVTGTCMVIVGVPLLLFPVPGPGVAMIASGVYVVSTEFQFARSWLETVKNRFGNVFDRLGIEVGTPEAPKTPPQGPSPPVLALPPSLPPAELDVNAEDSNNEDETGSSMSTKSIHDNQENMTLSTSDENKEKVQTNATEAVTMRI